MSKLGEEVKSVEKELNEELNTQEKPMSLKSLILIVAIALIVIKIVSMI